MQRALFSRQNTQCHGHAARVDNAKGETLANVVVIERLVDLDTPLDWKFAELLLKESL